METKASSMLLHLIQASPTTVVVRLFSLCPSRSPLLLGLTSTRGRSSGTSPTQSYSKLLHPRERSVRDVRSSTAYYPRRRTLNVLCARSALQIFSSIAFRPRRFSTLLRCRSGDFKNYSGRVCATAPSHTPEAKDEQSY